MGMLKPIALPGATSVRCRCLCTRRSLGLACVTRRLRAYPTGASWMIVSNPVLHGGQRDDFTTEVSSALGSFLYQFSGRMLVRGKTTG